MTEKVLVIKETWADSILSDAGTFVMFLAMIGLGVWLQSDAMQWVGAVVFFLSVVGQASARKTYMTIKQARAKLDEWEAAK